MALYYTKMINVQLFSLVIAFMFEFILLILTKSLNWKPRCWMIKGLMLANHYCLKNSQGSRKLKGFSLQVNFTFLSV